MSVGANTVLFSKFMSNTLDSLLHIMCEISLIGKKVIIFEQMLHRISVLVNVLNGLIDTILSNKLSGEDETILIGCV